VSEEDLGVNFFLEQENVGGFRAQHTCDLLKELNPDVEGNYITEVLSVSTSYRQMLTYVSLLRCSSPTLNPSTLSLSF
jgi:NEDD8-activating enzyme E1 regulatory subunit